MVGESEKFINCMYSGSHVISRYKMYNKTRSDQRREEKKKKRVNPHFSRKRGAPSPFQPLQSAPGKPGTQHQASSWPQEQEQHLDDIVLLHLQGLGRLVIVDPPAVEEEAERGDGDAHLHEIYTSV